MKPGPGPRRKSRLAPVSKRKKEKHAQIGARGPVCDFARRFLCALCAKAFPIDPAHEHRVGKGHGDWFWCPNRLRWHGKVAPLCRYDCHPRYDDNVVGRRRISAHEQTKVKAVMRMVGERWAMEVGVDLSKREHPYDQWRALGSPEPGDML